MNRIQQRILSYPHLSRDEQRDVEAYVEDHPEWASLLREVRALESLASKAQPASTGDINSDVLATYVVARHVAGRGAASELASVFGDIEDRLAEDADLQRQAEDMQRRIDETEAAVDPVRHFEEVTGEHPPATTGDLSSPRPARSTTSNATTDAEARNREPDRAPARGADPISRPARWAIAAVVLVAAVYGLLYAASWSSQSTVDRLAAMNVSTDVIESYQTRVRSPMPQASTDTMPDDLYLQALPLLRDARSSTLGLFPHFDLRKLNEAESLLLRVVDRTQPGSFLQLEAYFYLGKINLAQGDIDTARTQLKEVVRREGRRASTAYQILKELEEERPAGGGTASASLF